MSMTNHQIVTPEQWVEARRQLLAKKKEFTRLRDQLSLDLVPKGRDEAGLPHTMAWVRLHDQYGS
jgi:predicted dithiol-disulfide oxidoreductase (DUF899 family)